VHLVGLIKKKIVAMHGHMNVKCAIMSAVSCMDMSVCNVFFRATDHIIHVLCYCPDNQSTDELGPAVICLNVF